MTSATRRLEVPRAVARAVATPSEDEGEAEFDVGEAAEADEEAEVEVEEDEVDEDEVDEVNEVDEVEEAAGGRGWSREAGGGALWRRRRAVLRRKSLSSSWPSGPRSGRPTPTDAANASMVRPKGCPSRSTHRFSRAPSTITGIDTSTGLCLLRVPQFPRFPRFVLDPVVLPRGGSSNAGARVPTPALRLLLV